ncbi:MAG: ABC transporter permease [Clostridia bacterium]|nr:ABC transporter permease [Clostridia bacterium]
MKEKKNKYSVCIKPKNRLLELNLKEVWQYKDLIWLFVQRDFKTKYKQTILGPLWFIIQPLFSTIVYTLIFGTIAGLSTDGTPSFLFYLAGNVPWLFFSTALQNTSNTFVTNANVFGKVYFPRLVSPISTVITCIINFLIQFGLFLVVWLCFFFSGANVSLSWAAALLPLLIVQMALLGFGVGIIISALTTKYRDLQVLVTFGVSLWMYLTPVVYTASSLGNGLFYNAVMCNPMSPIIEIMRYGWLGSGSIPWLFWGISWAVTLVVLFLGIIIFNKVEKNFMDTV